MEAEFLPNLLSSFMNIVALCVFFAGIWKLFQVATAINEIRDVVKDIRRSQDGIAPAGRPASPASVEGLSGDEMLRALDVQLNLKPTVELDAVKPEIVNPR